MGEFIETSNPFYDQKVYIMRELSDLEWALDDDNDERLTEDDDVVNTQERIFEIHQWLKDFDRSNFYLNKLKQ